MDNVIGAVVNHPPVSISRDINIATCTFGVGRGSSIATQNDSQDGGFLSDVYGTPKSWPTKENGITGITTVSSPNYANLSGFVYPQR